MNAHDADPGPTQDRRKQQKPASEEGPDPVPPDAPRFTAMRSLAGRRLLLIEDDTQSRLALAMLLREAGAVVEEFALAEPAFEAFERKPPDLVLSDLSLPQEDGCSLMRRIRAAESAARRKRVPAIALTGMARAKDQQDALLPGFQRHIAKPLTPDQLFQVIGEVMDARN